jgi:hypothetical protein
MAEHPMGDAKYDTLIGLFYNPELDK